jgi:hypothetical protein
VFHHIQIPAILLVGFCFFLVVDGLQHSTYRPGNVKALVRSRPRLSSSAAAAADLRTGVVSAMRLRGIGGTVETEKEGGPARTPGIPIDIDQLIRRGWTPGPVYMGQIHGELVA